MAPVLPCRALPCPVPMHSPHYQQHFTRQHQPFARHALLHLPFHQANIQLHGHCCSYVPPFAHLDGCIAIAINSAPILVELRQRTMPSFPAASSAPFGRHFQASFCDQCLYLFKLSVSLFLQ